MVKALLRILVGAIVIVPLILLFVFSADVMRQETSGSAPDVQIEQQQEAADQAAAEARRDVAEQERLDAEAQRQAAEAEAQREAEEAERQRQAAEEAARDVAAAEAEAQRQAEEAERQRQAAEEAARDVAAAEAKVQRQAEEAERQRQAAEEAARDVAAAAPSAPASPAPTGSDATSGAGAPSGGSGSAGGGFTSSGGRGLSGSGVGGGGLAPSIGIDPSKQPSGRAADREAVAKRAYRRPAAKTAPPGATAGDSADSAAAPPPEEARPSPAEAAEARPEIAAPAAPAPTDDRFLERLQPAPPPRSAPEAAASEAAAPEAAPPVVGEVKEDWTIVPVYFGTDRQRTLTTDRVVYDWQRGRRLELGQALVTIPKDHEVPMVERPWALKIPYLDITLYQAKEDPKKHFTLKEIRHLERDEFLELVRERLGKSQRFKDHALIFVHGYKTTFDNAVFRTAQITYDLQFDGASFLYSWPSGGTLQGYTYDRESAAQSEPYMRKFLELVRDETGAKKVSIIAHSMGNQPLLRVLQDLKRSKPDGVQISQLILAAPDVDRDSFENIVSSIQGVAEGITLYAAANDAALMLSRRVNGGIPRAGDVPEGGPLVVLGVDTIDATATSMDAVGINHSGYAENNALLSDIGRLIGEGVRPPEVRLPKLERIESAAGVYWRYPAPNGR